MSTAIISGHMQQECNSQWTFTDMHHECTVHWFTVIDRQQIYNQTHAKWQVMPGLCTGITHLYAFGLYYCANPSVDAYGPTNYRPQLQIITGFIGRNQPAAVNVQCFHIQQNSSTLCLQKYSKVAICSKVNVLLHNASNYFVVCVA